MGILATGFPIIYALIPAHESSECICALTADSHWVDLIYRGNDPLSLMIVNSLMFYSINWCFILANVMMLHRIRHIRDRLLIREEMGSIVVVYTVFCYLQYICYIFNQRASCPSVDTSDWLIVHSEMLSYWILLLRDLAILGIVCYYLTRKPSQVLSNTGRETTVQLLDFDTVMLSVVPL